MASTLSTSSVGAWQENRVARAALQGELGHLTEEQGSSLITVLDQYSSIFKDSPGWTTEVVHDIDVGEAAPIKQLLYRVHPSLK